MNLGMEEEYEYCNERPADPIKRSEANDRT